MPSRNTAYFKEVSDTLNKKHGVVCDKALPGYGRGMNWLYIPGPDGKPAPHPDTHGRQGHRRHRQKWFKARDGDEVSAEEIRDICEDLGVDHLTTFPDFFD